MDQRVRFAETAGANNPYGIMSLYKPIRFTTGVGVPPSNSGEDYWQYVDTSTGTLYQKLNGSWIPTVDYSSFGGVDYAQSTGIVSGGDLEAGTNPNTFKITAGSGIIVTGATTPVDWFEHDNIIPLTGNQTFVSIDSAGAVVLQTTEITRAQRRGMITIGSVLHSSLPTIDGFDKDTSFIIQPYTQLSDLASSIGAFRVTGLISSGLPATLSIERSFGTLFKLGCNSDPLDPNVATFVVNPLVEFGYVLQDSELYATDTETITSPGLYESAPGVVSAVPVGKFTIQRIYLYASGECRLTFGQFIYDTLDQAVGGASIESYVIPDILVDAVQISYLILQEGITNLDSALTTKFIASGAIGKTTISGGAAASFDQSLNTTDSVTFSNVNSVITTNDINAPVNYINISAGGTGVINLISNLDMNSFQIQNAGLINGVDITALPSTPADIKILYESNANTNAFTDAEKTSVSYIATSAGVNPMEFVSTSINVAGSYTRTHISGNYAFVVNTTQGLLIYEISNKLSPIYYAGASGTPTYLIAALDTTGAYTDCAVVGNYAYVISTGTNSGLRVYDITSIGSGVITLINSPNPIIAGSFTSITAGASHLYITAGGAGIHRVSISNPILPAITATKDTGAGYDNSTISSGTIVYSHNSSGLEIIDATSDATFAGAALSTTPLAGTFAGSLVLEGTTLYLSRGNANGLVAYNVADSLTPILLYSSAAGSVSCFFSGGYLFSCDGSLNLLTAFLPNLTAPFSLASADPEHVTAAGAYVYVSNGTAGLDIYTTEGLVLFDGVDVATLETTANAALPKAGGTMTGAITMGANNIITSGLVDGIDISARDAILTTTTTTANAALPKAGGTMTGALNATSIIATGDITCVALTASSDVTQQNYDENPSSGARLVLNRSRGTVSVPAPVQSGDRLAEIRVSGRAATLDRFVGGIRIIADENFTDLTNRVKMEFVLTDKTVTTIPIARVSIESAGVVLTNHLLPSVSNTNSCGTVGNYWATSYAQTWTDVSDVRVKTNIVPFEAGAAIIQLLNPQTFDFNEGTSATPSKLLGLIAQDVCNVMYNAGYDILSQNVVDNPYVEINEPTESVAYTGPKRADDDVYSINYSAIDCLLINAVKSLIVQVNELKDAPQAKLSTIKEMTSSGESTTTHTGNFKDTEARELAKMRKEMKAMKAQIAGLRAEMDSMSAAEMMRSQREEADAFDLVEAPI